MGGQAEDVLGAGVAGPHGAVGVEQDDAVGAIVAREFGLPAVAGISEVHRRLKTEQRLRIDGAAGG